MLFYKLKKIKEKISINLIKPNTPLMNKTLNELQDLIENAQASHGTTEDWSWRFGMDSELKRPWHSQVECEGGGVYISDD